MLAELGMVLTDPGYRLADRASHTRSSALGRGGGSSATTTQAERARQLSNEEAAFGVGLRGPLGVPGGVCVLDVVVDLDQASAVGILGSRVEDLARVAECLRFDALDRLGGIEAPTLVIVGEQDLLTPPWIAREVAGAIPGARFEIVTGDGASHVMPLERPDDFNQLVVNFLAE